MVCGKFKLLLGTTTKTATQHKWFAQSSTLLNLANNCSWLILTKKYQSPCDLHRDFFYAIQHCSIVAKLLFSQTIFSFPTIFCDYSITNNITMVFLSQTIFYSPTIFRYCRGGFHIRPIVTNCLINPQLRRGDLWSSANYHQQNPSVTGKISSTP